MADKEKALKSARDRVLAQKVADDLECSFVWHNTKEGAEFWHNIKNRLERIAKEGE